MDKIVRTQEIVNSSQIKNLAYTEANGLIVTFKNDAEYLYKAVPTEVFEEMLKAESVGKFLNSQIKGKFEYLKLPPKDEVNG